MKTLLKLFLSILLTVFLFQKGNSQSTITGPGAAGHAAPAVPLLFYSGWDASTTIPFNLQHRGNQDINFFTGGNAPAFQRMTIKFNTYTVPAVPIPLPAGGFVGINTTTPLQRLHVAGDINLQTNIFTRNEINDGYRINNRTVLAVKNSDNLFVGFGAGASWTNALAGISENTFVGNNSGFSNNGGFHNAFFGFNSGRNNVTGDNNTFLGFGAGFNNTSNNNTFVGTASGTTNTTGEFNTFIGTLSGGSNTSGRFNTYLGCYTVEAGSPSFADHNTYIGFEAGQFTTSGDRNVLTGSLAGWNLTIGAQNVISGMEAGFGTKDGSNNVFIGWESAHQNITGDRNVFMGSRTGRNQRGDYCTFIGYEAGYDNTGSIYTLTNAAGIGNGAIPTANDKMILGNNDVNVGIGLSNDGISPGNKLEINFSVTGNNTAPNPGGGTGFSGLRFRDLNSASIPYTTNPGVGILSLDANGDVIYVPVNTATTLGNPCPFGIQNLLPSNWEIPLNNFNFVFSGQGTTNNNVGIGTNCSPAAKLDILQSSTGTGSVGLNVINTDVQGLAGNFVANGPYGIKSLATLQHPSTLTTTGIYGEAIFDSGRANYGVEGHSSQSSNSNYGGRFQAISGINSPIINYGVKADGMGAVQQNVGVNGSASGGNFAYGVLGQAFGAAMANYGIYGEAVPVSGTTPPTGPNYAGYFAGDVVRTGTDNFTSDEMLKTNIDTLADALSIVMQLRPKSFEYKQSDFPSMNLPSGKQFGFVAQDVQPILPEIVNENIHPEMRDTLGAIITPQINYLSLEYQQLIALLTRSIQQQKGTIDSLSQKLSEVITTVNSCCNSNHSMQQNNNSNNSISSQDVNLKDEQSIVLETNVPNPFAEQTTINYFLPDNVVKAQMLFYNVQGKLIQSVELTEKGKGSLNVFAQDLSNGIYTYTLVVDGKVFETKKMVKQK